MNNQTIIIIAAIQQLILAVTFLLIPLGAQKYGKKAQKAAEQSVEEQGQDGKLLSRNGIKFTESKLEMLLPLGFAVAYFVIALTVISGNEAGKTLTLIVTPITLLLVGFVTAQQVFATWFMKRAFKKSNNHELQKVNVEKFVLAALKELPPWLRPLQIIRFFAATVGSIVVLVLVLAEL